MKKIFLILSLVFLAFGCSMPETLVRTTDSRPQLAIKGAPEKSILYVDGLEIGEAIMYNGEPKTLIIQPGTHLVTVKSPEGVLIFNQKIFVESELKTISISGQR
ncbi:MAG TPA: hypothetical protein VIH69_06690 [Dehalococcoidia bacterium]